MTLSSGDLRAYMRQLAGQVWDKQIDAFSFGLSLQEETITEMLLLETAKTLSPHGLRVKLFTRRQEGGRTPKKGPRIPGTGADWEWFYDGAPCMARFRVQAKRLYPSPKSHGNYGGFNPGGQQIKDLINGAAGMNPVYVFYNHPNVSDHASFTASGPPEHFGRSCWGVGATTAAFMNSLKDAKLSTVMAGQVPWHRFFGIGGTCLPKEAFDKAHLALPDGAEGQAFIPATTQPDWVPALLENNDDVVQGYLAENDLAGVAYFGLEGRTDVPG